MRRCLQAISDAIASGEPAALVTIVEKRGSTPRGVGTAMVVRLDGSQEGTIGGGSMEARAHSEALALLTQRQNAMRSYTIDAGNPTDPNSVSIWIRVFFGERDRKMLQRALNGMEREKGYLVCTMEQDNIGETEYVSVLEAQENPALVSGLEKAPVLTAESPRRWLEPIVSAPRVLLFGGGHVAQKTAIQLAFLDYRVWIIEERAEFANATLFPTAERILNMPFETARTVISICSRDHAIVMTSAHETDYRILRWLLTTTADYIGCIGSRRKIAHTQERLLMDGMSLTQMLRIHAPVGLDIGAETPAEIAVSIAAELIAYRNEKETEEA